MNKVLLFAILLGAMIIGGAIIFVKKDPVPDTMPPPIEFDGQKVLPTEIYQSCGQGDRCIVVDTHCGFCCNYTAINARYEEEFNARFDNSCRRFSGQYCQCFDLTSYPACVEGKCQLVEWDGNEAEPPPPAPAPEPRQSAEPAPVVQPPPYQPSLPAPAQTYREPETAEDPFYIPRQEQNRRDESGAPDENDLFAPLPSQMPGNTPTNRDPYDPLNKPLPEGKMQ